MTTINNQMFADFIKRKNNISQKPVSKDNSNKELYVNGSIVTGITAIGAGTGYGLYRSDKDKFQNSFDKAKSSVTKTEESLKSIKSLLTTTETSIKKLQKIKLSKTTDKIIDVLLKEFIVLTEMKRKGKAAVFPNGIMLVGKNTKINNGLINWTGNESDCNFIKIKHTDDLLDCLEKAEENYQKTKKRTLLHVDGMDKLLNRNISPDHTIGALKDIMSATSDDYHSTIIFNTKDPSKLDSIAIGDNRVEAKIDVNIKSSEINKVESEINELNKKFKFIEKYKSEINEKLKLKEKLKIEIQKMQDLSKKIQEIPRTKLVAGAGIGFLVGAVAIGIKRLISDKNENDRKFC